MNYQDCPLRGDNRPYFDVQAATLGALSLLSIVIEQAEKTTMKVLPYRSEYDDQDGRPTRFAIFRMFVYCIGLGLALLTMLVLAVRVSIGNILRGDWLSLIIFFPIGLFGRMLYTAFISLRRMLERRARYPFEE